MFRTLLSFLLLLAVAAETSAQTTPAGATTTTATKTTARTRTTTRRPVKKARRTIVRKTTTRSVGAASSPAPAAGERTAIGPGGNGAVGSSATADSKGENVYAAPGMPVHVQTGKVESYNGRAAGERAPAKGSSTLTPAASPK